LREARYLLSEAVLDAIFTPGISPFDRTVDTGNHTGATLQTTGKFDHHLSLFIEGVKVGRTGIDAEPFLAGLTNFLIEEDVGLLVVFKGIQSELLSDLHYVPP
jgi:hypothetical protein